MKRVFIIVVAVVSLGTQNVLKSMNLLRGILECPEFYGVMQGNNKVVSLAANGTGSTKEEATRNALRSALEQAFGTFVSANTEVLNDDLVKDEIVTVSSGNILNYKELYSSLHNGKHTVSIMATVSIGNLVSYAQNKGMKAELAGATFAMNMKMRKLNKENELKAMENLKKQLCLMANSGLFDYQIIIGEPHMGMNRGYFGQGGQIIRNKNRNVAVDVKIKQYVNSKTIEFRNTIVRVLEALGLTNQVKADYKSAGVPFYGYYGLEGTNGGHLSFRNKYDQKTFMDILTFARYFFSIEDNLGHTLKPYMRVYEGKIGKYEWSQFSIHPESSKIYSPGGEEKIIPSESYVSNEGNNTAHELDNILYIDDYQTAYKDVDCFIECGISSNIILSKYALSRDEAYNRYKSFMKDGLPEGSLFGEELITLYYSQDEMEKLNSIQVNPIITHFPIERFVQLLSRYDR